MAKALRSTKVAAAAASVGLSDVLDRRPGQLSGGQRQRVASVHAGGFNGSPAMNFLSDEVSAKACAVVPADGSRIEIPAGLAEAHDRKVTQIGLRPEALSLVPAGRGAFDATFEFAEALGPARLYHFQFEDMTVSVLSADKPAVERGGKMGFKAMPDAVHLFAADTGQRLATREMEAVRVLA